MRMMWRLSWTPTAPRANCRQGKRKGLLTDVAWGPGHDLHPISGLEGCVPLLRRGGETEGPRAVQRQTLFVVQHGREATSRRVAVPGLQQEAYSDTVRQLRSTPALPVPRGRREGGGWERRGRQILFCYFMKEPADATPFQGNNRLEQGGKARGDARKSIGAGFGPRMPDGVAWDALHYGDSSGPEGMGEGSRGEAAGAGGNKTRAPQPAPEPSGEAASASNRINTHLRACHARLDFSPSGAGTGSSAGRM